MASYHVELYTQRPGTTNRKRQNLGRFTAKTDAMRCAVQATEDEPGSTATLSQGKRTGRVLLGSVTAGTFTPAGEATTDTTTKEQPNMAATTETKYIAHVWGTTTGKVDEKRTYSTERGALNYAEKRAAEQGVREVTVTLVGSTSKWTAKADKKGTVKLTESKAAKPAEDTSRKTTSRKGSAKPAAPAVDAATLTTWDDVLALTDSQLERAFRDGRPVLALPMSEDTVAKLDRFDSLYARFLAGARQTGPSGEKRYGISSSEQQAKRAALRERIGKAAKRKGHGETRPEPRRNTGRQAA